MRKILTIVLVLTMSIYLFACGQKKNPPVETNGDNSGISEDLRQETDAKDDDTSVDEETSSTNKNDDDSASVKVEEPSDEDMEIFNTYMEKDPSKNNDEEIQETLAEEFDKTPEEIKEAYLRVWQQKLDQVQ